ncbi:MAG: T4SS efffector SepA family protein [Stellaceae bacterium]
MTHPVELSDALFARLQKLAVPLVDNTETVIAKLADYYETQKQSQSTPSTESIQAERRSRRFLAVSPPDLTHTKVLSIKIEGVFLHKPTWNGLLFELIRRAKAHLSDDDAKQRLIIVNFAHGKKEDDGYSFIPEIGLSVQGQTANAAWKGAFHIARRLSIPIEVEFLWKDKEGAAFPGMIGRLNAV